MVLVIGLLISWHIPVFANAATTSTKITTVNVKQVKDALEIAIKAEGPIEYKTFKVQDPRKSFVIDIPSSVLWMKQTAIPLKQSSPSLAFAERVRVGQFSSSPDIVRVVVDLAGETKHESQLSDSGKLLTVTLSSNMLAGKTTETLPEEIKITASASKKETTNKKEATTVSVSKATVLLGNNQQIGTRSSGTNLTFETLPQVSSSLKAKATVKKPVMKKMSASQPGSELVSYEGKDADIVGVIKAFALKTNSNIIIDSAVKGTVTVKLLNVPLEQALSLILTSQGFGFRRLSGNVLVVAPVDKLEKYEAARIAVGPVKTQVVPLENAKAGDLVSTIKLSVPDAKIEVDSRLNALVVKAPLEAIKEIKGLVSQLDVPSVSPTTIPQVTEVIQLNYAQAKDVITQMRGLIPANAVIIDDRLNALIVTGTAGVIDTVRNFLNAVDVPVAQVMLEMNVVSVTEGGQKTLGLLHPASVETIFKERGRDKASTSRTEPAPFTVTDFITPGFHTFTRSAISLTTTLNMLVKNSEAKILANPKIATMNNMDATILVGERIPLVYYDPRAGLYQAQYIDTGVKLDVKPTISPDGYVTMKLQPQVSEPGEFIQNFPRISTRSAITNVRVKSGETVVIGGLIRETNSKAVTKYPLLGDIPILGELFKNRVRNKDKTDLIITVTPRILSQPGGSSQSSSSGQSGMR